MQKWIWLLLLLCSPVLRAIAQPVDPAPKLIAKLGALSLLDPILPSVNLMGEFQIKGPWYGQLEAGVILNADDALERLNTSDKKGFRFRPALRYYYQERRNRYFMELLTVYRQVTLDIEADFFIQPDSGPSYYRRATYTVNSRKVSVFFNLGLFEYSSNDRFVFEIGFGLGGAIQDNEYSDLPENASIRQTSFIRAFEPGYETTVADIRASGMLYFNLGYALF